MTPFSEKQMQVLCWWGEKSPHRNKLAVICDGAVRSGNVYGTQFHPEKSGDTGLRLLKAFAEL